MSSTRKWLDNKQAQQQSQDAVYQGIVQDYAPVAKAYAGLFDMEPNAFLNEVVSDPLLKAADPNNRKKGGPEHMVFPPRGFFDSGALYYNEKGVASQRPYAGAIPPHILRAIEEKNPVVSAIINTRTKQVRRFAQVSRDRNVPGYKIRLKDVDRKPTKQELEEMYEIEAWLANTGRTDFKNSLEREDDLGDVFVKITRDTLVLDQACMELRRDRAGDLVDFWVLDPATIRRVLHGGFFGKKEDIDPQVFVAGDNEFKKKLSAEKRDLVPDVEDIAFVQELQGRYVAAWPREDFVYLISQKRSDLRYYGRGFSPLQQAMSAVTAFLWGLAYNAEAFNRGTVPKIGLSFKNGHNLSKEQIKALQDEWIANHRGIRGAWRIPFFNKEVQVLDFLKSARDMEYMKYLEFVGSLIAAVMGMDLTEIGLRYQHAQNVLTENVDARQKFSKDRGLHDLLSHIEGACNTIIKRNPRWSKKYEFVFHGLSPEDRELESKIMNERVRRDTTVNELRKEQDKAPIDNGDIILEPNYIQAMMAGGGPGQGGEEEGNGQGLDLEGAVDDAFDDVFKAVDPDQVKGDLIK